MARLRAAALRVDRVQTTNRSASTLVEETHEVIDAIRGGNPESLCEELGDLLLQILFHAQIASENGQFSISDVIASISEKMSAGTLTVFGTRPPTRRSRLAPMDHIKKTIENRSMNRSSEGSPGVPSLLRAAKMSKKAARRDSIGSGRSRCSPRSRGVDPN